MRTKALCAVGLLLLASPALAQDHAFKLFGAAAYVSPLGEEDVDFGAITESVEAADELGWEFGGEWRFHKVFAIEATYLFAENDIEADGEEVGSVDTTMWTIAFNFHILPTKVVDFYVAPIVSFVDWGDITLEGITPGSDEVEAETETAYGAAVGLDIGLGNVVTIVTGLRYLNADVEGEDEGEFAVDPLIARLGLGFRLGSR